jgi:hypothetical protein
MTSVARRRLPRLPKLADEKLMKTGYTRGATVREVYQNRVTRNNPVLVPWEGWDLCKAPDDGSGPTRKARWSSSGRTGSSRRPTPTRNWPPRDSNSA